MVPAGGLEPPRTQCATDFESVVSTIPPRGQCVLVIQEIEMSSSKCLVLNKRVF